MAHGGHVLELALGGGAGVLPARAPQPVLPGPGNTAPKAVGVRYAFAFDPATNELVGTAQFVTPAGRSYALGARMPRVKAIEALINRLGGPVIAGYVGRDALLQAADEYGARLIMGMLQGAIAGVDAPSPVTATANAQLVSLRKRYGIDAAGKAAGKALGLDAAKSYARDFLKGMKIPNLPDIPIALPSKLTPEGIENAAYTAGKRYVENQIRNKIGVTIELPRKLSIKEISRTVDGLIPNNAREAIDMALSVGSQLAAGAAASALTGVLAATAIGSVVPGLGTLVGLGVGLATVALKGVIVKTFTKSACELDKSRCKCKTPKGFKCPSPGKRSPVELLPWLAQEQAKLAKITLTPALCDVGEVPECKRYLGTLSTLIIPYVGSSIPVMGLPALERLLPQYEAAAKLARTGAGYTHQGDAGGLIKYGWAAQTNSLGFTTPGVAPPLAAMQARVAKLRALVSRIASMNSGDLPSLRWDLVTEAGYAAQQYALNPSSENQKWFEQLGGAIGKLEAAEKAQRQGMAQQQQAGQQLYAQRLASKEGPLWKLYGDLANVDMRCEGQAKCPERDALFAKIVALHRGGMRMPASVLVKGTAIEHYERLAEEAIHKAATTPKPADVVTAAAQVVKKAKGGDPAALDFIKKVNAAVKTGSPEAKAMANLLQLVDQPLKRSSMGKAEPSWLQAVSGAGGGTARTMLAAALRGDPGVTRRIAAVLAAARAGNPRAKQAAAVLMQTAKVMRTGTMHANGAVSGNAGSLRGNLENEAPMTLHDYYQIGGTSIPAEAFYAGCAAAVGGCIPVPDNQAVSGDSVSVPLGEDLATVDPVRLAALLSALIGMQIGVDAVGEAFRHLAMNKGLDARWIVPLAGPNVAVSRPTLEALGLLGALAVQPAQAALWQGDVAVLPDALEMWPGPGLPLPRGWHPHHGGGRHHGGGHARGARASGVDMVIGAGGVPLVKRWDGVRWVWHDPRLPFRSNARSVGMRAVLQRYAQAHARH